MSNETQNNCNYENESEHIDEIPEEYTFEWCWVSR